MLRAMDLRGLVDVGQHTFPSTWVKTLVYSVNSECFRNCFTSFLLQLNGWPCMRDT